MKKLILPVLILLSTTAFGQIKIAPEIGINISNYPAKFTTSGITLTPDQSSNVGLRAGLALDLSVTKHFSLQPGIYYNLSQYKTESPSLLGVSITKQTKIQSLQIPIYLMYNSRNLVVGHIFVGIGPLFNAALSGTNKIDDTNTITDLKFGNEKVDDMKAFDIGGTATLGFEFNVGLFVRTYFNLGFSNLATSNNSNNSIKSRSFGLSVGYFFGS